MSEDQLELFESYRYSAFKQGDVGEILTSSALRSKCNMEVVRNVYLPYDGHYTEIDMIGVSEVGIFVIENKNYNGVVIGDISDKYWSIDYRLNSTKLYNPVLQNNLHKAIVKNYLIQNGVVDLPIFSPVIFNDKALLKLTNTDKYVFTLTEFVDAYNSVESRKLSKSDISSIVELFRNLGNISIKMRTLHVSLLRE